MSYDLVIVDGPNLLWRLASVMDELSAVVGGVSIRTGGIYGSLKVLRQLREKHGASRVIITWEPADRSTNWRYAAFPGYKANRHKDPNGKPELWDQELRLQSILCAVGAEQYAAVNAEADDAVATLVKLNEGKAIMVYSGDSDLRQLVSETVTVIAPGWKGAEAVYTPERVREKYGMESGQLPDFKALAGDSSDGIPGAPGIGTKYATGYVQNYGSLDKLLKAVKAGKGAAGSVTKKHQKVLLENEEQLRLFRRMVALDGTVELQPLARKLDEGVALCHMETYAFQSFLGTGAYYGLLALGRGAS